MRLEERRTIRVVLIAGAVLAAIPVLYLASIFAYGTFVAPPPVPETRAAPDFVRAALWARADGGAATELRPINPFTIARFATCMVVAEGTNDDERMSACRKHLPAIRGLEYLANLHLKDHQVERASFRGGAGSMATMVRLTQSFTRENFLDTLATRADFGYGWRGVEAAAQGLFGRAAGELTLPQAALIASRVGALDVDPWCDAEHATTRRNITLRQMRENGAIDEESLQGALGQPLGLASPPTTHKPCTQ